MHPRMCSRLRALSQTLHMCGTVHGSTAHMRSGEGWIYYYYYHNHHHHHHHHTIMKATINKSNKTIVVVSQENCFHEYHFFFCLPCFVLPLVIHLHTVNGQRFEHRIWRTKGRSYNYLITTFSAVDLICRACTNYYLLSYYSQHSDYCRLWAEQFWSLNPTRPRDYLCLQNVLTSSEAHLASYPVGTGVPSWGYSGPAL